MKAARASVRTVALLALGACAAAPATVEGAREQNQRYVGSESQRLAERHAQRYVVVQEGGIAAAATAPDDAVRAAERSGTTPLHRFVFRPDTDGERAYRMAFMPSGGIVVGRRFFEAFGARAAWRPGKPLVVERLGSRREIDLEETPRLDVRIETLDREREITLSAVVDLDFDGALLVPPETALELGLERFEIPGEADVQVALGRPFRARRALVLAHVPLLRFDAPVEVAFETPPEPVERP